MNIDYSVYYARFHDDSAERAEQMAEWLTTVIGGHLPADKWLPLVDIGCGYGFAMRAMRNLGYTNLVGVDVSPQQAERCKAAGFSVVVPADTISWLTEHQEQFGGALLLDVLEHIPVPQQIKFAAAVYAALRPGAKLIVTVPNANAMLAGRWRYNDYTHHCSFTEHSLHFVLRHAGFQEIEFDASKGLGRFPRRLWRRSAREALRRWIVRWCWLQVFKAEIPWERLGEISFELNLKAVATKR